MTVRFDPRYLHFSWSLAEQQERRNSITAASRELIEHIMIENASIEDSLEKLFKE